MSRGPTSRVLMVAADAGEISFIRSHLGGLPTFRRLLSEGAFFPLHSTADHIPASVWPTMYTGTMPGEHGISQHIQWDPGRMAMRRITADWLYTEPFWYGLSRSGLGVTVLDVPFTFGNRLPPVVEVSNWGSHDLMGRFTANPPGLARDIRRRFGRHPMGYEIPVNKGAGQLETMRRELVTGAERKGRLARWLRETTTWDLFLAVFGECHRGGHILWHDPEDESSHVPPGALVEVYRAVDAGIGHVLEGIDTETTTVVVFALHGMGRNFSQEHFVRHAMDRINASFRDRPMGGPVTRPRRARREGGVMRLLRESVPPRLQHAIARGVPVELRDWVVSRETTGGLDWDRTPGFALRSDLHSFVRLNVSGREREGLLEEGSDAYNRYVERLTAGFLSLRIDGTNLPVIRDVVPTQRVFPGARQELLPDFILRWTDHPPASRVQSEILGELVVAPDRGRTGEHRPEGFALVVGPGARAGPLPPLAHNRDFPGFVTHLLNLP